MPPFEKAEIPNNLLFNPRVIGDWIDMPFILKEVDSEIRTEVLAVALETMANVHQNVAEGARKVASIIRGSQG